MKQIVRKKETDSYLEIIMVVCNKLGGKLPIGWIEEGNFDQFCKQYLCIIKVAYS